MTDVQTHRIYLVLVGLALVALVAVTVRTAWVSDDAYITFRVLDNAANGYGLRWNVAERVQAYTHPLWLFVLLPGRLAGFDPYGVSLAVAIALTVATGVLIALRGARSAPAAFAALGILVSSRAFVDYSTSGLENVLTHFLLAAVFVEYWRPDQGRPARPFLLAALCVLNRPDVALLVAPAVVAYARRLGWRRAAGAVMPAVGLIAAWEVFSLIYYGFAFPNTAYAKLGTSIPRSALLEQGLNYLRNSWSNDPVTLAAIGAVVLLAPLRCLSSVRTLAAGVLLYVVYVVTIGGDFMAGRFLSAPLLASALGVSRLRTGSRSWLPPAVGVAAIVVGLCAPMPNLLSGADVNRRGLDKVDGAQIADERLYYWTATGWLAADRQERPPDHHLAAEGRRARLEHAGVVECASIGFFGYSAGPGVHVVDPAGLADPLLARLPHDLLPQRIGHFNRRIPDGYLAVLAGNSSSLAEPSLNEYYRHLAIIARGPLFTAARWKAIVGMNLGWFDGLILQSTYGPRRLRLSEVAVPIPDGTPWDGPGTVVLREGGVAIELPRVQSVRLVEVSLDGNDAYRLRMRQGARLTWETVVPALGTAAIGLRTRFIPVKPAVTCDRIEVLAGVGDRRAALGHLRVR